MNFYMVMVNVNPGLTIVDVQAALTNDIQWFRVANNVWIVHTYYDKDWLYSRLQPLANPSGTVFIVRFDLIDHQGWMNRDFIDWFNKRRALAY